MAQCVWEGAVARKRAMNKDAVRLRHQRVMASLVETGGDVPAVAAKHHLARQTVYQIRNRPELRERFWQAAEQVDLTLERSLVALKEAHDATLIIVTPKGKVIRGEPDHKTRITAAGKFLAVAAALEKVTEAGPVAPEAPATRPLTVQELMNLPIGTQQRVIMEARRVLIEPIAADDTVPALPAGDIAE